MRENLRREADGVSEIVEIKTVKIRAILTNEIHFKQNIRVNK